MKPGSACACKAGYQGSISWKEDAVSGTCVPAPCTVPNSNMKAGTACACKPGYLGKVWWIGPKASGDCTPAARPLNGTYSQTEVDSEKLKPTGVKITYCALRVYLSCIASYSPTRLRTRRALVVRGINQGARTQRVHRHPDAGLSIFTQVPCHLRQG